MQNDKPKYAINLKDERIVYRSKATDEMKALYRWIPNDVAKAIMERKLEAKKVVNLITKKMFSDENFDHNEYEAELKKLNVVFKEEEVPEPEEVVDTTTDNPAESVTMDELTGGAGGEPAAPTKKPTGHRGQTGKKADKADKPEKPPAPLPADNADGGEPEPDGESAPDDEELQDV